MTTHYNLKICETEQSHNFVIYFETSENANRLDSYQHRNNTIILFVTQYKNDNAAFHQSSLNYDNNGCICVEHSANRRDVYHVTHGHSITRWSPEVTPRHHGFNLLIMISVECVYIAEVIGYWFFNSWSISEKIFGYPYPILIRKFLKFSIRYPSVSECNTG